MTFKSRGDPKKAFYIFSDYESQEPQNSKGSTFIDVFKQGSHNFFTQENAC